jgi:hypothetical protein
MFVQYTPRPVNISVLLMFEGMVEIKSQEIWVSISSFGFLLDL